MYKRILHSFLFLVFNSHLSHGQFSNEISNWLNTHWTLAEMKICPDNNKIHVYFSDSTFDSKALDSNFQILTRRDIPSPYRSKTCVWYILVITKANWRRCEFEIQEWGWEMKGKDYYEDRPYGCKIVKLKIRNKKVVKYSIKNV